METTARPDFNEVYAYAKKSVDHFIRKHAFKIPNELKEEIVQNAMMRVWEAYKKLDAERGWKSFIQLHCRGAVLDFIKMGSFEDGFTGTSEPGDLQTRVEIASNENKGSLLNVDDTAALFGIFAKTDATEGDITPNWNLLNRMAGKDEGLAIVSKVLLGFSQEDIACQMSTDIGGSVSRERVSQRIYEYFELLDAPCNIGDPWIEQSIFALGLSAKFSMPGRDNGIGWNLMPFNLQDQDSFKHAREFYEPSLFNFARSSGQVEI